MATDASLQMPSFDTRPVSAQEMQKKKRGVTNASQLSIGYDQFVRAVSKVRLILLDMKE